MKPAKQPETAPHSCKATSLRTSYYTKNYVYLGFFGHSKAVSNYDLHVPSGPARQLSIAQFNNTAQLVLNQGEMRVKAGTYQMDDGGFNAGEREDDILHDTGVRTYAGGRVYRGEFADGEPHGAGQLTCPDGSVLSGTWRAGRAHGCMKLTTADDVREVEYVDGVAADTGTVKYNDGTSYEGELRQLRAHGKGVLTAADGSWVYRGEFANGKRWGDGVQLPASFQSAVSSTAVSSSSSSSSIPPSVGAARCAYAGPWEDDKKHGRGIEGSGVQGEIPVAVLYEKGKLVSETPIAEAWSLDVEWHLAHRLYVDATVPDFSAPVDGMMAEYLETVRRDVLEPTLAALTSRASELATTNTSYLSDRFVTVRRSLARVVELASEMAAVQSYVEAVRWATAVHEQTQAVGRKTGTYRMNDGALYEGEQEDGIPHGTGVLTHPDGAVHRGEFADGVPHGAGQLTWPDGSVLSGTWRAGRAHGSMKLTTADDVSVAADTGTVKYSDGRHYAGQMKDGIPHGTGVLTHPDGAVHRGEFADGVPHGAGQLTWPDGSVLSCTWRAGRPYRNKQYNSTFLSAIRSYSFGSLRNLKKILCLFVPFWFLTPCFLMVFVSKSFRFLWSPFRLRPFFPFFRFLKQFCCPCWFCV